jgi:serine/threonine-protein kinase
MTPLRVFDRFELLRKLSSGGYGDIFLARQVGLRGFERLAVLKSLRPEIVESDRAVSQFLNEARTAARLNHPNVVAIYEVDEWRGVYFIAMEYIDGVDLAEVHKAAFRHEQRIPFRIAAAITAQAALGLDHAHRATDDRGRSLGIVHLDISPQNIMVRKDGIAKVVDFGVASSVLFVHPDAKDVLQGKLRYMSPEQLEGEALDGKSDQFSLGIVLWELCVGQRMFAHSDPETTYEQITGGLFPKASSYVKDIPGELEAVIAKMMAYRPDDRFASCREASAALDAIFDDGAAREPRVERFVGALLGKKIRERTADLEPKPLSIPGLLDSATRACSACHRSNPVTGKFCTACGAPLDPGAKRGRVALRSGGAKPAAEGDRSLGARAVVLATMLVAERRRGIVLSYRALGKEQALRAQPPSAVRDKDRDLVRGWTEIASRHGATIVSSNETGGQLFFGSAEMTIAVRCALELVRAAEETFAPARVSAAAAIAYGEVEVLKKPRLSVRGATLDEADRLAEAAERDARSGVFLSDSAARNAPEVELAPFELAAGRTFAVRGLREAPPVAVIGRRAEMLHVAETLATVEAGTVASILFGGDPGSGKTAVLRGAEEAARARGLAIEWLDGRAASREPAIQVAARLIRSGLERISIRTDSLDLIGIEGSDAASIAALLSGEPLNEAPNQRTVALALRKILRHAPVILLADDLHLAPGVGRLLRLVLDGLARAKLGLIATADAAEIPEGPWRTIALPPLSDDKLLAIASARLGAPVPPIVAQILLERASGNPATLCLLTDVLRDRGAVRKDPAGDRLIVAEKIRSADLPDRIDGLVSLRVSAISDAARRLLTFGAVYGPEFPVAIAARAASVIESSADEILSTRLVERDGDHLRFVQPAVCRAIAASVVARDAVEIHRQLARSLAALASPADPAAACRIASHAIAGRGGLAAARAVHRALVLAENDPSLASLCAAACAIVAERRDRLDDRDREIAVELGARAIACMERIDLERAAAVADPIVDGVVSDPAILLERGRVLRALSRLAAAKRDLSAVLESGRPELRSRALAELAKTLEAEGSLEESATTLAEALELGDRSRWEMLNDLGRLHVRLGRLDDADALFDEALAVAGDTGRGSVLTNQAAVLAERGDGPGALARLEDARASAEAIGDDMALARIDYNRGRILLAADRSAEGVAVLEAAADVARAIGWTEGEALALGALEELKDR